MCAWVLIWHVTNFLGLVCARQPLPRTGTFGELIQGVCKYKGLNILFNTLPLMVVILVSVDMHTLSKVID